MPRGRKIIRATRSRTDLSICSYCGGPNDRAREKNRNGRPPTRCSRCKDGDGIPAMSPRERARLEAMLARPTWW